MEYLHESRAIMFMYHFCNLSHFGQIGFILKMSFCDGNCNPPGMFYCNISPYDQAGTAPRYRFKKVPVSDADIFRAAAGFDNPVFNSQFPNPARCH
jgi:hypothetical protein